MNAYNLYSLDNYSEILYHAIAEDEEQVKELAEQAGYDISSLDIDLERTNVKNQIGRPCSPRIENSKVY